MINHRCAFCVVALLVVLQSCGMGEDQPDVDPVVVPVAGPSAFLEVDPVADLRHDPTKLSPQAGLSLVFDRGWSHSEPFGSWAKSEHVDVVALLPDSSNRTLRFECRPFPCEKGAPRQAVTVSIGDYRSEEIELEMRWHRYEVPLPQGVLGAGANRIGLTFRHAMSPKDLGMNTDDRHLAAGFRWLALTGADWNFQGPEGAELGLFAMSDPVRLRVNRSGRAVFPWRCLGSDQRLSLGAQPSALPTSISLLTVAMDGQETLLGETAATETLEGLQLAADLPDQTAGSLLMLAVDVETPRGSPVDLQVTVRADVPRTGMSEDRSRKQLGSPPDIVVLIPDALRPDHLGLAGYGRQTSPYLDRLAQESLVFTNAVTAASYSLASSATIISGLSPLRHGVVTSENRLSDEVSTLAELLSEQGYATLGLSANAYHSPHFGSDQGYDRFVTTWKMCGDDDECARDPHRAVEEIISHLRQGFAADQPLFLLMHLVPPHTPYDPPPEFDLFSSSSYDGPMDGNVSSIQALMYGEIEAGDEDMEQLVGLYDGNIRRVDDAIRGLLEGLQVVRQRWRNTAVIVISDHGEAFGEHGWFGHTPCVYDEVLRVPFILRLPQSVTELKVDVDRLVSLEDVLPTALGLAGLDAGDEVDGLNVLSLPEADRVVISRNGGRGRPTYSVRTRRWKAIVHELRIRELYDLQTDYAQRSDVAGEHRTVLAGLEALLAEALKVQSVEEEASPLESQEIQALRALGYLQQ